MMSEWKYDILWFYQLEDKKNKNKSLPVDPFEDYTD